jgi:hypothetical protein
MNDFAFLRNETDSDMPPLNRAELLKWLLDWKGDVAVAKTEYSSDSYYVNGLIDGVTNALATIIDALQDDTMPFNQG